MLCAVIAQPARQSTAPVEEDEMNYEDVSVAPKGGRSAIALYDYQGSKWLFPRVQLIN